MKFLIDENLPPSFCAVLRQLGYQARHVNEVDLDNVPDEMIVLYAEKSGETIITNDLDFSRIMAKSGARLPSIVTFRLSALNLHIFEEICALNFERFSTAVDEGALISIDENSIRIRKLPVFSR
jgi:predicted nuclease of predicted toxin-antitoxin system